MWDGVGSWGFDCIWPCVNVKPNFLDASGTGRFPRILEKRLFEKDRVGNR